MNRSRLTLAVTKFQPAGKRNQGRLLEWLLVYIETETGHEALVLEIRIRMMIIMMMMMMMMTAMTMVMNSL